MGDWLLLISDNFFNLTSSLHNKETIRIVTQLEILSVPQPHIFFACPWISFLKTYSAMKLFYRTSWIFWHARRHWKKFRFPWIAAPPWDVGTHAIGQSTAPSSFPAFESVDGEREGSALRVESVRTISHVRTTNRIFWFSCRKKERSWILGVRFPLRHLQ